VNALRSSIAPLVFLMAFARHAWISYKQHRIALHATGAGWTALGGVSGAAQAYGAAGDTHRSKEDGVGLAAVVPDDNVAGSKSSRGGMELSTSPAVIVIIGTTNIFWDSDRIHVRRFTLAEKCACLQTYRCYHLAQLYPAAPCRHASLALAQTRTTAAAALAAP